MAFNPQQLAAINHGCNDGALLVSAAAGSGKTTVMAQRVKRLLADPELNIRADKIFVSTFTRAAAAELRSRIARLLTEELDAARREGSQSLCAYLQRQRVYLQRAAIGTTDSYCIQLVRQYFALLDVPPDFEVADQAQLDRIERQIMEQIVEKHLTESEAFRAFAGLYGRSRDEGSAQELCLALHRYLQSLADPKGALADFAAMWQGGIPVADTLWGRALADHWQIPLADFARRAAELADMAREDSLSWPELAPAALLLQAEAAGIGQMAALLKRYRNGSRESWDQLRLLSPKGRWKGPGKKAAPEAQRAAEALKESRESLWKEMERITKLWPEIGLVEPEAVPLVQGLIAAVLEYEDTLMAAKKQEKKYSFSDCEHLALELLWQNGARTPLAEELSRGFATVMVDEYQDTNELQDKIYACLARPDGSNLFFVGDIKQSIYKFRQADPAIFQGKLNSYGEEAVPGQPRQIALNANYRSSRAVIEGCNGIFDLIMTPELGGVLYNTPAQQLRPGDPEVWQGSMRAVLLESAAETEEEQQWEAEHLEQAEAAWVAAEIRKMLEEKLPVRCEDGLRPVEPEDICVLMRSRRAYPSYLAALDEQGITASPDTANDLLECDAVRPLAGLLRVLDNPTQDMELTAAMLSPLLGFTADDLVRLRTLRRRGSLYHALEAGAETQPRFKALLEQLTAWSQMAFCLPVDQLLEEIQAATRYPAVVRAKPDGETALAELQAFVQWAAARGESGLHSVIRAMDAAQASGRGIERSAAALRRKGCVSMMTAHSSKGLEFPVVFVCDLGHSFNKTDENRPVLIHNRLGVGLKYLTEDGRLCTTAARRAIACTMDDESISEEMRILYVALTRAKDHLVLPLVGQGMEWAKEKLEKQGLAYSLSRTGNWRGWLLLALAAMPQGRGPELLRETLPKVNGLGDFAPEELQLPDIEPGRAEALQARWQSWERGAARRAALEKVPIKTSVSAISHKPYPDHLARPAFARSGGHLTGAEKGTLTHRAMQLLHFAKPFDLDKELARIETAGLMSAEEIGRLDRAALETFLRSPGFAHICTAQSQKKEYPFITSVPAATAMPDKTMDYGSASCLVQGVADLILIFADHAEIWDWKTDRGKTAEELRALYQPQLWLYKYAIERRLDVPVTRCVIYSLTLGQEIEIPLV